LLWWFLLQVGHEDWNLDGKADLLRFVAEVQSPIDVHSLKLVLQLSYALQVSQRLAEGSDDLHGGGWCGATGIVAQQVLLLAVHCS
jgi:hypothetical protein